MKKLAAALTAAGLSLFGMAFMAAPVGATSANDRFDLPNGTHVKVDICHNVDHNPHIVPVSINSAKFPYSTGHGDLVLNGSAGFVSFSPHIGTGGHQHDFVARVYLKKGNHETNTYVSERECKADEPTTTTTQPPTTTTTVPPTTTTTAPVVTTTTQPPVTTTTQPPVTTTTEPPAVTATTQPPVVTGKQCVTPDGFVYTTNLSECPVAETPAPVVNQTPITALPHTGAWSLFLALLGTAAGLTGLGLMLFSRSLRRTEES